MRLQPLLHDLGQLGLVVALRRHRDERGGETEEIGGVEVDDGTGRSRGDPVVAQDVVELGLVVALALGRAGARSARTAARTPRRGTPACGPPAPRSTTAARRHAPPRRRSRASITGMPGLRITPSPSTQPSPTRAPCVTMQRLPIVQSSPMITGAACGGSSTPPMPTPPERCTRSPICAHDPTVAQVSTIVSAPTRAPMFT